MLVRMLAMLAVFTMASALPAPAQTLDKAERICAAAKLKATAKKVNAKIKCEAKAIVKELSDPDPACLTKAEEKFTTSFSKAESKGGCVSDGDAATVEGAVDSFVAGEVDRQTTGTGGGWPTCSTPNQACGSCGMGYCVTADQGNVCVNMSTQPTPPPCANGTLLLSYMGQSICAVPCP